MIKKIFFTLTFSLVFCIFSTPVLAAPNIGFSGGMADSIANKAGFETGLDDTALSQTVGGIIRGVLTFIGVIFLVLTIYAGILWMTAGGKPEPVDKAKKIVSASVIGLTIIAAAYGVTALVFNIFLKAQAPGTDVGGYGTGSTMGCCYSAEKGLCAQTKSAENCRAKWKDGYWYGGVSCSPDVTMSTGCEIRVFR